MELHDFKLDSGDAEALCQCEHSQPAVVLLKIVKAMYDKEAQKMANADYGVNDLEPKRDFRCGIGIAATCRNILELPKKAKEAVEQLNKGE